MTNQLESAVQLVLKAWEGQVSRAGKLFSSLSDEQLQAETAPGRNSGYYLLGHLIAVHDALLPLLGLGEKLYPQLEQIFIKSPDKAGLEKPPIPELRNNWQELHTHLAGQFSRLTPEEWLQKHTAVSDEDFAKEPHRNRLNVLLSRTNHLAYHMGQLVYLENKS